MRLAPIILAFIGIWGLFYPHDLSDSNKGGGRWLFCIILVLAALAFWRSFCRNR